MFTKIRNSVGCGLQESVLQVRGYTLGKKLGEGTHATVRLATYDGHITGHSDSDPGSGSGKSVYAVKIVDRARLSADFVDNFCRREMEILRRLQDHENIVKVHQIVDTREKVYIFMQYASKGDLHTYIEKHGPIPEVQVKPWFKQIVSAVDYCHQQGIAHRDLKSENILITSKNMVILADFGLARFVWLHGCSLDIVTNKTKELSQTYCGSPAFAAPEIIRSKPYNPLPADIWSLGIVLYHMLSCELPFDDSNLSRMLSYQIIRNWSFTPKVIWNPDCQLLILQILEPDINQRITIIEILNHSWLQATDKNSHQYLFEKYFHLLSHPPKFQSRLWFYQRSNMNLQMK